MHAAPGNILVIRLDFLGDMVCTTPLLAALRREYPQARISVLATKYNRVVLDGNPDVDEVFTYVFSKQTERNARPGAWRALWDRLQLIRRLRRQHFDLVIIPNGGMNKNSINFARQLGATRVVHRDATSEFDDRNPDHVRTRPIEHEALSGFRLLNLDPERHAPLRLKLHLPPGKEVVLGGDSRRPAIGLFVTARDPVRIWPTEHWITLAKALAERARVVIVWSPGRPDQPFIRGDDAQAAQLRQALAHTPEIYFVPTPAVPDLMAVAAQLDLAVTPDGAPVHICAAFGRPIVALFENRKEKYGRWYPLGVAHRIVVADDGRTVADIAPAAVIAAVQSQLAALAPSS